MKFAAIYTVNLRPVRVLVFATEIAEIVYKCPTALWKGSGRKYETFVFAFSLIRSVYNCV